MLVQQEKEWVKEEMYGAKDSGVANGDVWGDGVTTPPPHTFSQFVGFL